MTKSALAAKSPLRHRLHRKDTMSDQSSVGVYETLAQAEAAVRKLDQGRFPITQVSIVAQNLQTEKEVHGFITAGDVAKQGAGTGAWFGGLFGLLMGIRTGETGVEAL